MLFATAAVVVVGEERYMDHSLSKLVTNNDKLTEINVQRKKVANFIERWGYFFGYIVDEIIWMNEEFSTKHEHKDHSGTLVIETDCVTHLEKFNGYLDYMIDSSAMDNIISQDL